MTEETIDLLVLTTGGSIDAHLDGSGNEVFDETSHIPQIIEGLGLRLKVGYADICLKNSDDITNEDRERMYEVIAQSPTQSVVVTHGLNTIKQTHKYLGTLPDKTIVLVGSKDAEHTYGTNEIPFALGFAIASSFTARHGVYRVDNGRLLDVQGRRYDHNQFRNSRG